MSEKHEKNTPAKESSTPISSDAQEKQSAHDAWQTQNDYVTDLGEDATSADHERADELFQEYSALFGIDPATKNNTQGEEKPSQEPAPEPAEKTVKSEGDREGEETSGDKAAEAAAAEKGEKIGAALDKEENSDKKDTDQKSGAPDKTTEAKKEEPFWPQTVKAPAVTRAARDVSSEIITPELQKEIEEQKEMLVDSDFSKDGIILAQDKIEAKIAAIKNTKEFKEAVKGKPKGTAEAATGSGDQEDVIAALATSAASRGKLDALKKQFLDEDLSDRFWYSLSYGAQGAGRKLMDWDAKLRVKESLKINKLKQGIKGPGSWVVNNARIQGVKTMPRIRTLTSTIIAGGIFGFGFLLNFSLNKFSEWIKKETGVGPISASGGKKGK